jgi:hypothetical protein
MVVMVAMALLLGSQRGRREMVLGWGLIVSGNAIFMWLLCSLSLEDQSRGDISAVADFLTRPYKIYFFLHFLPIHF